MAASCALLVGLLAWHLIDGTNAYLNTWAKAEPTQRIYNSDFRAAAAFLNSEPPDEQVFIGTDRLLDLDSSTFGFYQSHRTDVNWFEFARNTAATVPWQGIVSASSEPRYAFGLRCVPGAVREYFSIPLPVASMTCCGVTGSMLPTSSPPCKV